MIFWNGWACTNLHSHCLRSCIYPMKLLPLIVIIILAFVAAEEVSCTVLYKHVSLTQPHISDETTILRCLGVTIAIWLVKYLRDKKAVQEYRQKQIEMSVLCALYCIILCVVLKFRSVRNPWHFTAHPKPILLKYKHFSYFCNEPKLDIQSHKISNSVYEGDITLITFITSTFLGFGSKTLLFLWGRVCTCTMSYY